MSSEEPSAPTETWEEEVDRLRAERSERERLEREALAAEDEARQASAELQKAAASNRRRVLDEETKRERDEWTGLLDGIMRRAEAATGLTREQLLATPDEPPKQTPEQVHREAVANRGVPEKHLRAVFDKPPAECSALKAVRDFLASERTFLVLSSTVGCMKSGSACWALTQRSGLYLKCADVSGLAASRDQEALTTWRAAKRVGLLVLDDIGADYFDEKGWLLRALNSLIDTRYENMLKTILTTNLDAAGFRQRLGIRVTDRIREDGSAAWEPIEGESVRGREPGEDDS